MKLCSIRSVIKRMLFRPVVLRPVYVPVLQSRLLLGRKALITGGTSGIGYAIACAFARSGAKIAVTGRDATKVKSVVHKIEGECGIDSGQVYGLKFDSLSCDAFSDTFRKVDEKLGGIDILVNNAGIVRGEMFGSASCTGYDEVMDTNLRGPFFLSQCISEEWKKKQIKGNILNICSASSLRPGDSAYILSKWGMRSLTLGMARDLIKYGIVVNGLAPGPTDTPHFVGDGQGGIGCPGNPSGRLATMTEIANLAVILVSDMGRLVVGDVLYATGGAGVITYDDV